MPRLCGCPHGCNRECDEEGRCPFCWNNGKGCLVLFHAAIDEDQERKYLQARYDRLILKGVWARLQESGMLTSLGIQSQSIPDRIRTLRDLEQFLKKKKQQIALKAIGQVIERLEKEIANGKS